MDLNNKKTYLTLFSIIFLVFAINMISFKNGHNWGDDFAEYIGLAKNIVDGTVDKFMSLHRYRIEHATLYVYSNDIYWGISFLLSPLFYFFGLDINVMKDIHVIKIYLFLFFPLSLFIVFLLFRDKLNNFQNLLLVAIIGFNPYFFDFKDSLDTDIPYFFFSLFSLFLIKRFIFLKKIWVNKYISYLFIGFVIFLSYFMRPIGIILLPTLLCAQFFQSRSSSKSVKDFIVSETYKFIPYVIFSIFMLASNWFLPGDVITGHGRMILGNSISTIFLNIKYYLCGFAIYLPYFSVTYNVFGFGYDKIHLILYTVILSMTALGMIHKIKDDYVYILYMLFNIIVLIIFPGRDKRLLMPLFPFFIYFLLAGFSKISLSFALSRKYNFEKVNAAHIFAVGLILTSFLYISHETYKTIIFNRTEVIDGPYTPDSIELFNYIKENTKKDDAIIFHKPRALSLYTGRKSFAISHFDFTPDKAYNSDAKYIVISKTKYTDFDIRYEDFQGGLACEFENKSFLLCDLKKPKSP
jgi:hypothetical protein